MAMLARSESRDGYAVRVLAIHTSEGNDRPDIDDAASLRDASWWVGSSHAIADDDPGSLLTPAEGCVPYDRAAWTLRSGNRWSENIELVGFAKWKRGDWLARPNLLDACARWLAARSVARGIPLVKLSPKEYAAGRSGVIGHVDHTVGYNDGTHWDPGPDFPYDVVLDKARAYAAGSTPPDPSEEDDMSQHAEQLDRIERALVGNMPAGQSNFHWVEQNGRPFDVYRSNPEWGGTGEMALAAPGFWWIMPGVVYLNIYISKGLCAPTWAECTPDEFAHLRDVHLLPMKGRLTAQEVADAVMASIPDASATPPVNVPMTDEQIERMVALIAEEIDQETAAEWQAKVAEHAKAVADEQDRRARDGDSATGPTS